MKTCNLCREDLPKENYSRCSARKDGLQNYCKKCAAIKRKKHYENNKEIEREQNRKWHQENQPWKKPEKIEYMSKWLSENRDRKNLTEAMRRNAIRANGGSVNIEDWIELCNLYGNVCLKCGKNEVTMDHIVPVSKGGRHSIENLQPLCGSCNSSKGTKTIDYRS